MVCCNGGSGETEKIPDSPIPRFSDSPQRHVVRVLLADDHKVMREGLATLLSEESDIEVVGQAGNGRDAVALARRLRPDVVVMDVSMPVMDGVEAARQIKAGCPDIRIIGLSMSEEKAVANEMLKAGAQSYLRKTDPSERLLAAIRGKAASD